MHISTALYCAYTDVVLLSELETKALHMIV